MQKSTSEVQKDRTDERQMQQNTTKAMWGQWENNRNRDAQWLQTTTRTGTNTRSRSRAAERSRNIKQTEYRDSERRVNRRKVAAEVCKSTAEV